MAKATGVLAGRVTTSIDPGAPFALPVPGALVTLSGPESRQAITDANGSYRFERLSPGPYAVQAWQPGFAADAGAGQQLTPSPLDSDRVVEATGPGVVQNFTCASPCQAATAQPLAREVDPARELVIKDSAVVEDARADNAAGGPWSFRYLMERMAWGTSPNVLAESWMANMARSGRDVAALRSSWPTIVEVGQVVPDLARAPFRLLAIVNRLDLRAVGNGELRFIYGIYPVAGAPTFNQQGATFTISIDFHLPTTPDLTDRQAWARRFHDLGAIPFEESARYNSALQALTDVVDARPATFDPRNPSGSNLSAFRVNERFRTSAPAQLRQFRLQPDPSSGALALTIALLPQTPDWALAGTDGMLPQLLNQQAALVQTGFVVLPDALLGSVAPAPSPPTPWSFPSITSQPLRQAFAGQTCMGCHWSEVPGPSPLSTFHVDPTGTSVSAFVSQIDLPRRIAFLRHQLTCSAASCAAGGAEMMPPPP